MTRINALRTIAGPRDSVGWGKDIQIKNVATSIWGNTHALIFAAVLIVCSVTVGCSSEKPKPVSSNSQIPVTQTQSPVMPAPAVQADSKPAPKKVVHKKPATVNYTDKTYGLTFEYPRRYAIETGDDAADLLLSNPVPMNFVQPGGVALAAVELPMTGFANTDFSSAFFNVSVNKTLTADQCAEFAVPQPKAVTTTTAASASPVASAEQPSEAKVSSASTEAASTPSAPVSAPPAPSSETQAASTQSASAPASTKPDAESQGSKLMLGDLELRGTEAVSGEGTRQNDSKYFHVFQNGACYEFALNVTTVASEDGITKHVDRDKVFNRLERILATVKINPIAPPEVTAEAPAPTTAPQTPAQ